MFCLRHPNEPTTRATCGYDPFERGYFVDLAWAGVSVTYDATSGGVYDDDCPLKGALVFLAAYGFLSDIEGALASFGDVGGDHLPGEVRQVLRAARAFEEAAGV